MPSPITQLPTHLTDKEKRNVFATNRGWETEASGNDNPNAQREVLTALPQLATKIGDAEIQSVNWTVNSSNVNQIDGGTLALEFVFNEEITGFENASIETTNETDSSRNVTLNFVEQDQNIARFEAPVAPNSVLTGDTIVLGDGAIISANGDTVVGFVGGAANTNIEPLVRQALPTLTIG